MKIKKKIAPLRKHCTADRVSINPSSRARRENDPALEVKSPTRALHPRRTHQLTQTSISSLDLEVVEALPTRWVGRNEITKSAEAMAIRSIGARLAGSNCGRLFKIKDGPTTDVCQRIADSSEMIPAKTVLLMLIDLTVPSRSTV
jgi:hypothetical protein